MAFVWLGLSLLCLASKVPAESSFRLCATDQVRQPNRCQLVERGNSQVTCVNVADSVDCALKLQQGLADFGVFNAEQALLASNFIDKSVQVIADIRHKDRADEPYAFQAVAVVRSDYAGTLQDLKGKKFCHPGYAPGQLWTDSVLKYFERSVVPTPCRDWMSEAEQGVNALSNFFISACRPGPWVQDDLVDTKLKQDYSNLCELCDSQKTCSYASHETGSHRAALRCLTHRGGDVTYVALQYVKQYFGLVSGFDAMAPVNEYKFLCPDGSTVPLTTGNPCAWLKQPWSAVLARRDMAVSLQGSLVNWLTADRKEVWQEAMSAMILESDHVPRNVTSLLSNFVRQDTFRGAVSPSSTKKLLVLQRTSGATVTKGKQHPEMRLNNNIGGETRQACTGKVKWCTTSPAEQRKCEWISEAVSTHGIQPPMTCVPAANLWECFEHIKEGTADLVATDTEYGHIARKSFKLSPIAYQDSAQAGKYQVVAVLSSSNTNIKSWKDLRQRRACFPEFGGLAWVSLVATLRHHRLLARMCPHSLALGRYLNGACAPGARDIVHTRGTGTVPTNLCLLCSDQSNATDACSTTQNNVFYGDLGALRCLASGSGDMAILDYRQLLSGRNGGLAEDIEPSAYKILCRNGSLALYNGLSVDEDCALAVGIGAEVLARADRSETKDQDLTELLLEMDEWFGTSSHSPDSVIHMYHEFQGTKDLLFKDTTVALIMPKDDNYRYINSYAELQKINYNCTRTNGAISNSKSFVLFPLILAIFLLFLTNSFNLLTSTNL